MATLVVYSDAGGDGGLDRPTSTSWATQRGATSAPLVTESPITNQGVGRASYINPNYYLGRTFFPFDTSSLATADVVTAATLSIYIDGVNNIYNDNTTYWDIVQSNQASNTALATTDFGSVVFTAGGSIALSAIGTTNGYRDITLGSTAWVGLNTWTKLAIINGRDLSNSAPTGLNQIDGNVYTANETGTTKDPKLTIVYTPASINFTASLSSALSLADNIDRISNYSRSLTGAITLTDNIGIANQISRDLSSALTLTDLGVNTSIILSVYLQDSLSVSDSLDVVTQISRDLSSNLALTDLLTPSVQYNRASADGLTLADSLDFTFLVTRDLTDTLILTDNIDRVTKIIGKSIASIGEVERIKPKLGDVENSQPKLYKIDRDKPILYSIRKG